MAQIAPKITSTDVSVTVRDGSSMNVYVSHPVDAASAPGLLLLQEAFGVNDHIRDVAQRFAREGYVVAAPELYHRSAPKHFTADYGDFNQVLPHFQALTVEGQSDDLKATHEYLTKNFAGAAKASVAVGFCMGGRAAFLANAILPLKASVSFYGGRIAPDLLPRAKELSGRQLLVWGGRDQHIDPVQIESVVQALKTADKAYVNVTFGDADHGFYCDARPQYSASAANQAWALTLQFLRDALGDV